MPLVETQDSVLAAGGGVEDPLAGRRIVGADILAGSPGVSSGARNRPPDVHGKAGRARAAFLLRASRRLGKVVAARRDECKARMGSVVPVLVGERHGIARLRAGRANPEGEGEPAAEVERLRAAQERAAVLVCAGRDAEETAADGAPRHERGRAAEFDGLVGRVEGEMRGWRGGRPARRAGFIGGCLGKPPDWPTVEVELRDVDAEVRKRRRRGVACARNAGDAADRSVLPPGGDERNGVGLRVHLPVIAAPAAVVGGDEDEPVLAGEVRARGDGVERASDPAVGVRDGGEVFGRIGLESVAVAGVVGRVDIPHRRVGRVGAREKRSQMLRVGCVAVVEKRDVVVGRKRQVAIPREYEKGLRAGARPNEAREPRRRGLAGDSAVGVAPEQQVGVAADAVARRREARGDRDVVRRALRHCVADRRTIERP